MEQSQIQFDIKKAFEIIGRYAYLNEVIQEQLLKLQQKENEIVQLQQQIEDLRKQVDEHEKSKPDSNPTDQFHSVN